MGLSSPQLASRIQTEADAYKFLEELRWTDDEPVCPHCGSKRRHYFLEPKTGTAARKTRTGSMSQRRVWKCADCRKQFSVLTGTILHGTARGRKLVRMTDANKKKRRGRNKDESDKDRLAIPLDPEEALRGLLRVDPESEPAENHQKPHSRSEREGPEAKDS